MFSNTFKTATRSLKKNGSFTLLNILGLALGITTCLLILFYVLDEFSFDKYNLKADRIFRINTDLKFNNTFTSRAIAAPVVASKMMKDFPEVEKATRILPDMEIVKKGEEVVAENNAAYCDANIFEVFTLPLLFGNPAIALKEQKNVVISESIARKYFDKVDVLGQTMTFMGGSNASFDYKITGVMKDIPNNSHFHFDMLFLMPDNDISRNENVAALYAYRTYLLLKPGADYKRLESKFPGFLRANLPFYDAMVKEGSYMRMNLTPLKEIHLHSNRTDELGRNSDIQYVKIFSASAVLILFIACFNFMNLSTARSANRAREVGVRKVLGSSRGSLIKQFLSESLITTICACLISFLLSWALLPWFNELSGKQITLTVQRISWLLPAMGIFIVVVGILAGSYPAFFLSAFKPIEVLKNKWSTGSRGGRLRNVLVVFQFTISIFLIICTLVVFRQIRYIHNKNIGFDREEILVVKNLNSLMGDNAVLMKTKVKRLPGVVNATLSSFLPVGNRRWENFVNGHDKEIQTQFWPVDENYLSTFGMHIVKGRNFSKQFPTDSNAVLINETAEKMFAFTGNDPLNQGILYGKDKHFHIVGVVKDFNFNSLRENVTPTLFMMLNGWSKKEEGDGADNLSIKIKSADISALVSSIEKYWKSFGVKRPFDYSFMDDDFNELYNEEQRMANIFVSFAILAIVVACLGLVGLAAHATEQRNKEIGIRKILGAGISNIISLLTRDFIRLVFIAILIATPLAWLIMQKWLQDFAFRVSISGWLLLAAGIISMLIAFLTVISQSFKAATSNPVKSLRSE
jgi:putative ABC transport system permease protein